MFALYNNYFSLWQLLHLFDKYLVSNFSVSYLYFSSVKGNCLWFTLFREYHFHRSSLKSKSKWLAKCHVSCHSIVFFPFFLFLFLRLPFSFFVFYFYWGANEYWRNSLPSTSSCKNYWEESYSKRSNGILMSQEINCSRIELVTQTTANKRNKQIGKEKAERTCRYDTCWWTKTSCQRPRKQNRNSEPLPHLYWKQKDKKGRRRQEERDEFWMTRM